MSDDPSAFDLLQLSTTHLRQRVAPALDAQTRYDLLLAARAAEIAWRDRALDAARAEAERAVERAIAADGGVGAIRSGACDASAELHGALLAMTAIATSAMRPDLLDEDERRAVEALRC